MLQMVTPHKRFESVEGKRERKGWRTRWVEWLELTLEQQQVIRPNTSSLQIQYDVDILYPTTENPAKYIILEGRRKEVTEVIQNIIRLIGKYPLTNNGAELMMAVKRVSNNKDLPRRIWFAGHVLETVDVDPSLFGLVLGREGSTLASLKRTYGVAIHVPS